MRRSVLLMVMAMFAASEAYCRPLDGEEREVCQELSKGDPVEYEKCAARLGAVSQEETDWSVQCYESESRKLEEAAKRRGMSVEEVPDDIILGLMLSCESRNPHKRARKGE